MREMIKRLIVFLYILQFTVLYSQADYKVWEYWDRYNTQSRESINHSLWDSFLEENLIKVNNRYTPDYSRITSVEKNRLDYYIDEMCSITIQNYNSDTQKAYWINLYNALTVQVLLDNYPVRSIMEISTFLSQGPWGKKLIKIDDKKLSLRDIKERILMPIWKDYRIHYILFDSSISGPELFPRAVTAQNLEQFLSVTELNYINKRESIKIEGNMVVISTLIKHYGEDLAFKEEQMISYLNGKLDNRVDFNRYGIRYAYNWLLFQRPEK